jgi:hypothetical protein
MCWISWRTVSNLIGLRSGCGWGVWLREWWKVPPRKSEVFGFQQIWDLVQPVSQVVSSDFVGRKED